MLPLPDISAARQSSSLSLPLLNLPLPNPPLSNAGICSYTEMSVCPLEAVRTLKCPYVPYVPLEAVHTVRCLYVPWELFVH